MKKKRNGRIDFLRFVFALIVVLHHTRYLLGYKNTIFIGGSLGVEFFFLVSGYLMLASIERISAGSAPQISLGSETLNFLGRKVKGICPEFILSWLAGFIVVIVLQHQSFTGALKLFISSFWELTLVKMSGIYIDGFNGVIWYVSSMLLCMAVLYPLLRRFPDMMKKIVCPLAALLLMGFLCQTEGHPRNPTVWMGLTYKGNLRAFAELCMGIVCYQVTQKFSAVSWNRFSRFLIEVLQTVLYIGVIVYMYLYKPMTQDYFFILLLCIAVMLSFSGLGAGSWLFDNRLSFALGKFSTALFFSHLYYAQNLNRILPETMSSTGKVIVYLFCAFVTALVIQVLSDLLRKNGQNIERALKRVFLV